jgi:hypothetical protein
MSGGAQDHAVDGKHDWRHLVRQFPADSSKSRSAASANRTIARAVVGLASVLRLPLLKPLKPSDLSIFL